MRKTKEIITSVYQELRQLATNRLAKEPLGQTLSATALVHEVYDRLAKCDGNKTGWEDTAHFFGAAARAMRQILIENARRKQSIRRGGDRKRIEMEYLELGGNGKVVSLDELLDLDDALTAFELKYPVKAQLVELRYFAGLSIPETAREMNISESTAKRYWNFSKAWLTEKLG